MRFCSDSIFLYIKNWISNYLPWDHNVCLSVNIVSNLYLLLYGLLKYFFLLFWKRILHSFWQNVFFHHIAILSWSPSCYNFLIFLISFSFLDICPKRVFKRLILLKDSDKLKHFLNMKYQKSIFKIKFRFKYKKQYKI